MKYKVNRFIFYYKVLVIFYKYLGQEELNFYYFSDCLCTLSFYSFKINTYSVWFLILFLIKLILHSSSNMKMNQQMNTFIHRITTKQTNIQKHALANCNTIKFECIQSIHIGNKLLFFCYIQYTVSFIGLENKNFVSCLIER